jgi:curli biogenesis system outer membrane secretion channel CsgG
MSPAARILALAAILLTVAPAALGSTQQTAYLPHIQSPEPTPTPQPQPPCATCSYDAYNCRDFSTRPEAQACFDYCYELTGQDVHRLDADHDMLACEWLADD